MLIQTHGHTPSIYTGVKVEAWCLFIRADVLLSRPVESTSVEWAFLPAFSSAATADSAFAAVDAAVFTSAAASAQGLVDSARHVIRCRVTKRGFKMPLMTWRALSISPHTV